MNYSASNRAHLMSLATRLRSLSPVMKAHVAGHLSDMRVMFPPWFLRTAVMIGSKRRKCQEIETWLMMYRRNDQGLRLAEGVIEDTARWAVDGMDQEQPDSAGGFSQRELNYISGLIDLVGEVLEQIEAEAA
jgi:hypothetical protein